MTPEQAKFIRRTKWFRTRPVVVQKAIFLWPVRTRVTLEGAPTPYFVVGYTETQESKKTKDPFDLMLILSPIDPSDDYDASIDPDTVIRICARHLEVIQ